MSPAIRDLQQGQRVEWKGAIRVVSEVDNQRDARGYPTTVVTFEDGELMWKAASHEVEVVTDVRD